MQVANTGMYDGATALAEAALVVEEALMIEPTEPETKETMDGFVAAMLAIAEEAAHEPELLRAAPHHLPNSRLDEAQAARRPDLRWAGSNERQSTEG